MSEIQFEKNTANGVAKAPVWQVTPELDLYESGSEYLIALDVPGATAESVNVQVVGSRVFIRAEQAPPAEAEGHRCLPLVKFERQFDLPGEVDANSASAELRNGCLELRVAKSASTRRVKIPVNTN